MKYILILKRMKIRLIIKNHKYMWRDNWSINHGATVNYLKKVSLFSIPYIKKFPSKLKLEKTQNKNKIHIFFNF